MAMKLATISILLLCAFHCLGQVVLSGGITLRGGIYIGPAITNVDYSLPTNDLVLRISAESTENFSILANGRITNATDLSGQGNTIAQTTGDDCPYYRSDDGLGKPCIAFPRWLGSKGDAKTHLQLTGAPLFTNLNSRTQSVYAVMAMDQQVKNMAFLGRADGNLFFYLHGTVFSPTTTPPVVWFSSVFTSTNNPKLFIPVNRTVVSIVGANSSATVGINDEAVTLGAPTAVGGTQFMTMKIGGLNNANGTFYGRLYELLIYATNHSPATRTSIVQTLTAKWNINTNYDGVIVPRGDSITEGAYATNYPSAGLSWPAYLMNRLNNRYKVYNLGISGSRFTTPNAGAADEIHMAGLLRDSSSPTNHLLELLGVNDSSETNGEGIFIRLTNWAQSVSTIWPATSIRPITMLSRSAGHVVASNYNTLVIGGDATYGSPIDIGLGTNQNSVFGCWDCYTNTIYYDGDGTHLKDGGTDEIARLVKLFMGL